LRKNKRLYENKNIEDIERNRYDVKKFFNESGSIKTGFRPQTIILSDESGMMR